MPRPPQTESRSTPSRRAASRMLVPSGKRSRLPDGVKTTRGSLKASRPRPAAPALAPPPRARLALGRRLAVFADPCAAIGVVTHHHVGAENRLDVFGMQRVHDRRGETGADHHRPEGGVEAAPVGQAE